MGSGYWRVEFISPPNVGSDRCVQLHGQLEEVVGPMSIEMAEAWIDRFDNQQPSEQHAAAESRVANSPPKPRRSKREPAG